MPGIGTGQLPPHFVLQQGRYVILARVGMGGMGAVYRAADTRLGNKAVAIKEMSDAAIPNPQHKQQAIAAFQQEAQMLAHLDHPNLPKVTDFFTENGKHYIVMEFVEGETLESTLQRQRVGEAQVRLWAAQLLDVLGYLHRQNPPVIFRDLKPANVLLTPTGQLKLIDFGIARVFKAGKPGDTLVMGTRGYAAPEQHGIGQTDARSDIYSLGVVLHQALTGYDPSLTPFVLPPVHQFNPSVSPQMEQAIAKAIQTDRLQRFQSVDQFRAALAVGVTAPGGPIVKTAPAGGQVGKLAVVVAGAAVLLLLAFLGGRALFGSDPATPTPPSAPVAVVEVTSSAEPEASSGTRGGEVAPVGISTDTLVLVPIDTPEPALTDTPTDIPLPGPTDTPSPTPTISPTPQPMVRADGVVNVRSGPSTQYPIIGQVAAGTEWFVQGRNPEGDWLQICCVQGQSGWIASRLVTNTGPFGVPVITDVPPPPTTGVVIFGSDRNGYAHVFTVDANGQGLRAITSGAEYHWNPIFSPDGSQIAYVSKTGGNTEIFVTNRTGANRRAISNHAAADDHPAWFPGNRELAFASQRDGPWQIYRMNADGSNVRRLTWSGGDDRFVDVSPDGSRIAYVALAGANPTIQVMVMNADGSNSRSVLTYQSSKQRDDVGRYVFRPDWSPDGRYLAFGADDNNDSLISTLIIDVATGDVRRLLEDGNGPAWSPDGQRLTYKPAGEPQILFISDASGQTLSQLTDSSSNAWSPDWVP